MINEGRALLTRLVTPGKISGWKAFSFGVIVVLGIFVADILTDSNISLHTLYAFPIAFIALQREVQRLDILLFLMALICAEMTLISYDLPVISLVVDSLVTLVTSALALALGQFARTSHVKLEDQATKDVLTELFNRRAFENSLQQEIARWERYGGFFSLAVLDLDGFKELNDTMGHNAGDEALKRLAELLRADVRKSDFVARIGGDEFVVLMPNTSISDCAALCEQFRIRIEKAMADAGFKITASIGCNGVERESASSSNILLLADKAMYAAKKAGKNCVMQA